MRLSLIVVCVILMLSVSGCGRRPKVTTEDFDLNTALEIVKALERPVLKLNALNAGDIISRSELEELQKRYELFSFYPDIAGSFFYGNEVEDLSIQELRAHGSLRYPTLFDGDIGVSRAFIETTAFNDARADIVVLIIEQSAVNRTRSVMDLFRRSYTFAPNAKGGWQLYRMSGQVNMSR